MNNQNFTILLSFILSFSLISCKTSTVVENSTPVTTENKSELKEEKQATLTPAPSNWQEKNHIHSIGVNPNNPDILYLATHHGILMRNEKGEYFEMGNNRDDFMTFVTHPHDNTRFYGSGHPSTGGNMGFVVTEDGGENWQEKSLQGVDFHALAVAPSNPDLFYGWVASSTKGENGLLMSSNGGQNWQVQKAVGLKYPPFGLMVSPQNSDHLFATTRGGVYESKDSGNSWAVLSSTEKAPLAGLLLVKENEQIIIYGYQILGNNQGNMVISSDMGKTWQKIEPGITGIVLYLTNAPSNSQILYAVNDQNMIFKSIDAGKNWKELNRHL